MSMIGNFRSASDSDIEALLTTPKRIELFLYGEYFDPPAKKRGLLSFFFRRKQDVAICSTASNDTWAPETDGPTLDVDKAWHGMHFLLCGDAFGGTYPLNFIVAGGTPIGDVDIGYGPARAYTSTEVAEIAQAIQHLTTDQLRARFDSKIFLDNKIYPEIWNEPVEECLDSYVLSYFEGLKAFVLKARDDGRGLIVYFNGWSIQCLQRSRVTWSHLTPMLGIWLSFLKVRPLHPGVHESVLEVARLRHGWKNPSTRGRKFGTRFGGHDKTVPTLPGGWHCRVGTPSCAHRNWSGTSAVLY